MHLPGPIYESIPIVYLACGFVSTFLVKSPFSVISTILFCFAAWMVWKMRKDYRSQKKSLETREL
jgi:hypothetical protein